MKLQLQPLIEVQISSSSYCSMACSFMLKNALYKGPVCFLFDTPLEVNDTGILRTKQCVASEVHKEVLRVL